MGYLVYMCYCNYGKPDLLAHRPLGRKKEGVEVDVGEAVKRNFKKECWT